MLENELADVISLSGTWQIEVGEQRGAIRVPGAWEAQGYSGKAGVIEPAVYRRAFDVPATWDDADVWLRFGAVSYYAEVLVNGVAVGTHEGLWTAFELDVTHAVRGGETNTLEVRVTKPGYAGDRFPYRDVLVGFLPYVFDNFGGIWQDVTLVAHQKSTFEWVTVDPNAETGSIQIRAKLKVPSSSRESIRMLSTVYDAEGEIVAQKRELLTPLLNMPTLEVQKVEPWSPASPTLYTLSLQLEDEGRVIAEVTRQFGFRTLRNEGERLLLNDAPIHLRGALSWGWDPNTLAPMPTDDDVRDEFRRVRELGFNMVKLCLFVPPENVFRIADEEGMLLWLELPLWLPNLSDHLREQARVEYADIMQRVMHHPSVVIYSLGCELGADMADAELLAHLTVIARQARGSLMCDNSGSGEAYGGLTFDYADFNDYHFYADLHYFAPLLDLFHRDWRPARPLIFGEFCDSDDYRDPAALLVDGERPAWRDFLGVEGNLDRWAYSVQEGLVAKHKLPFTDAEMAVISRKQSFVIRKTILERTRTRREIGGYVLTGLRDTPMSSSGVFDDAGQMKYDPQAFRQFNGEKVLLLEQGRSRRWVHGGDRPYRADLRNHRAGAAASFRILLSQPQTEFAGGELVWRLVAPNGETRSDSVTVPASKQASPLEIARIELVMPEVERAEQWTLEAELDGVAQNQWALWVYPVLPPLNAAVYDPAGTLGELQALPKADFASDEIVIAGSFTPELERFLREGGRAVLIQPGAGALPTQSVPFWRESIKLICDHPVMNAFPHTGYADLQFYHLATDCAFDTAAFGEMDVTPVMRRLDARLFTMLDYVVDVQVGKGRLLATTLRLLGGEGDQVEGLEANVAGEFLLHQMVKVLEN